MRIQQINGFKSPRTQLNNQSTKSPSFTSEIKFVNILDYEKIGGKNNLFKSYVGPQLKSLKRVENFFSPFISLDKKVVAVLNPGKEIAIYTGDGKDLSALYDAASERSRVTIFGGCDYAGEKNNLENILEKFKAKGAKDITVISGQTTGISNFHYNGPSDTWHLCTQYNDLQKGNLNTIDEVNSVDSFTNAFTKRYIANGDKLIINGQEINPKSVNNFSI